MSTVITGRPAVLHPVVQQDLVNIALRSERGLRALSGSRILITGGAGFLPSYLVDALAYLNGCGWADPCRIVAVDNLVTGQGSRLAHLADDPNVEFVEADLTAGIPDVGHVDYIVHGASVASPTWYRQFPLETIDVNVTGTRALLELAREQEVRGFLYLSSSEVYGDPPPDRVPTHEDYWGHVSCTGPRACYDESKRLAETLCMTYHRQYDVPVKIVRPFNVYGPRLRLDDGRVVPDFIRDALEGRPITLLSDGQVTRSFCYVEDATLAMLQLLVADVAGEAFNVGNDEEVTIRRLAEIVGEIGGGGSTVEHETSVDPNYLVDNPQRRCPDLSKTMSAIRWKPDVDLVEGIDRTYRSYLPAGS